MNRKNGLGILFIFVLATLSIAIYAAINSNNIETPSSPRFSSVNAIWRNLTVSNQVSVTDVTPACYPDAFGISRFRGHFTLSPVPATGCIILAILPGNDMNSCVCTPMNDNVIFSTTAIVENGTICHIRGKVAFDVIYDVNQDGYLDVHDANSITSHPQFNGISCGSSCGRQDVNKDTFVNTVDVLALLQVYPNGTFVGCGAITAVEFSCRSTILSPLTTASSISIDGIDIVNG
jgi:hypothetical protein